jgi:hypothetical protein
MGKYEPLGRFLREQGASEVPMSFADIERILGTKLPPKAQNIRAWWSNNPSNNVMTKVWLQAGFKTVQVDMAARRLVFRRSREPEAAAPAIAATPSEGAAENRHPLYGAMKGLVHIMPGTDLTEPADPEWGDIWDKAD